jgi:hypothetical protein
MAISISLGSKKDSSKKAATAAPQKGKTKKNPKLKTKDIMKRGIQVMQEDAL